MKPSESLHSHREAILAIAQRNGVQNVRVFGSVIHGRDRDGSDLDLLIDAPRGTTLLDMVRIQNAIEAQIGLPVDVLTAADLPPRFRDQVLLEARPL
jgi:predicted nucleotidyltransferase